MDIQLKSALISVYDKAGLDEIVKELHSLHIKIYSTGGTWDFIHRLGIPVEKVEDVTGYPSILDGRVKTLHPKVFGGILAIRNEEHLRQLEEYSIPTFDLVIVDLYPFEATVASTTDEKAIIEKIDIGGISLIRAAAKNFGDVMIIPSKGQYSFLLTLLREKKGLTSIDDRKLLAAEAFCLSSHYDHSIFSWMASASQAENVYQESVFQAQSLRYGENPHQKATFFGDLSKVFHQVSGKELSYNNLVDIDAAIRLMADFLLEGPTVAIIKHTNPCGIASNDSVLGAWSAALKSDPVSAFGGIIICNSEIDSATAAEIDQIFYEVLIAPSFSDEALSILQSKAKRTILKLNHFEFQSRNVRSVLNGVAVQERDAVCSAINSGNIVTTREPDTREWQDLLFAEKCAKHLKSNTIALVKNRQLLGMGCGQTSRIDACHQAVDKALKMGFDLHGAVMASDAFFPFPDCVEVAAEQGITAVIQPGGSIKDQHSIDSCNQHQIAMVCTGIRHFLH